jgi:hypothetical protein
MAQSRKASSEKTPVVALRKVPAVALTIGRPEMLVDGSDQKFRRLVQGVFTFAAVHEAIRDSYAAHVGLGGVQYTILQIIRHFGTDEEMSIGDIAGQLRLSGSFITNETARQSRAASAQSERCSVRGAVARSIPAAAGDAGAADRQQPGRADPAALPEAGGAASDAGAGSAQARGQIQATVTAIVI